jgi:hypothetical protein
MNIYKITFNGNYNRYIIAISISEAESIWNEKPDRFPIQMIELITTTALSKDRP